MRQARSSTHKLRSYSRNSPNQALSSPPRDFSGQYRRGMGWHRGPQSELLDQLTSRIASASSSLAIFERPGMAALLARSRSCCFDSPASSSVAWAAFPPDLFVVFFFREWASCPAGRFDRCVQCLHKVVDLARGLRLRLHDDLLAAIFLSISFLRALWYASFELVGAVWTAWHHSRLGGARRSRGRDAEFFWVALVVNDPFQMERGIRGPPVA